MKKILLFLCALVVFLCMSFSAWAVPTTWEVTENYLPPYYISFMNGKLLYLDLGDDGYVPGMEIDDFTLTIRVSDDRDAWYEAKTENIILAAGNESNGTWSVGDLSVGWSLLGEWDIEDDGTLNFLVESGWGDFCLNSATLLATGDDGITPPISQVPEPTTVLLFGLGLMGLAGVRRKIKK
jgi:hypothetical protein